MTPTTDLIIAGGNAVKHAIMRTISILCVLLVCAGLYYAVYRTFIKPRATESYAQKAENITNIEYHYYPNKRVFFVGVNLWGVDIGVGKYAYPEKVKENEIISNTTAGK